MDGVDLVVHTAAALPLYSARDIYTTDVEGTRTVLDVARQRSVERAVMISSTAVYGIPDHHPLLEDDRLEGVGPYGQAKIQAEMVCLEYRAKGLVVPIIRPKSFIGPERLGVFDLLFDWALDGRNFPMIGSGNNRYQLLDVEDLCEAIYLALTLPVELSNDTFNIGAKEFSTMREDYQAVLDYAGFDKKIVGFPATPAILGLRVLEAMRVSRHFISGSTRRRPRTRSYRSKRPSASLVTSRNSQTKTRCCAILSGTSSIAPSSRIPRAYRTACRGSKARSACSKRRSEPRPRMGHE